MEPVEERLKELVAEYLSEYGCPQFYAKEIVEGILDNFVVARKQPPPSPSRSQNSSPAASER